MTQEEKLLHYKEEIGKAKIELSQLEGEEKSLLKRLKEDHGLKSVEEAKKRLRKLEAENTDLDEKLKQKLDQLEKEYEFD